MLVRVLYSSRAVHPQGHISDLDILRTAQIFNTLHELTGFLFRSPTHFFQVIEGDKRSVDQLLAEIKQDTRHIDVQVHMYSEIIGRVFGPWAMGYGDLTERDSINIHGFLTADSMDTPEAVDVLRQLSSAYA